MAEKFSVKHEGKEIWAGMAMTESGAISCAKLAHPETDEDTLTAEIVPFTDPRIIASEVQVSTKTRKPRADKGQPRKSIQQPQKEAKGRRYLVAENVKICNSRAELESYLSELSKTTNIRIFNYTHELKAKSQFKLETV